MKGCFDMIEDNIAILLKDNGKISYISRDKLSGNVRKKLKKKILKRAFLKKLLEEKIKKSL